MCPSQKGHEVLLPHLWVWGAHQKLRRGLSLRKGGKNYLIFQQPSRVSFSPNDGQGGVPHWCPWQCIYSAGLCQGWAGGQESKTMWGWTAYNICSLFLMDRYLALFPSCIHLFLQKVISFMLVVTILLYVKLQWLISSPWVKWANVFAAFIPPAVCLFGFRCWGQT